VRLVYRYIIVLAAGIFPAAFVYGQDTLSLVQKNKRVGIYSATVYGVGLLGLNQLWYKDYERSALHSFNDNAQWLQMDKVGHSYSTYTLSKLSFELYHHNNEKTRRQALLYSSISSFAFLTTVELFDGYSKEWGFSWGDFVANTSGIALFALQEQFLKGQVVQLKYSFLPSSYADLRPNTLGSSLLEQAFKDYNGQTYWASINLNRVHRSILPKWLSVAFGFGANQMIFADKRSVEFENQTYRSERQFYLSLDVDWEQIETNKAWLKWAFKIVNCIKIPAPSLILEKGNSIQFSPLYF
jgi:uncharacterized protein YfiM (DUF2279 family)